jgi:hypothetical protein
MKTYEDKYLCEKWAESLMDKRKDRLSVFLSLPLVTPNSFIIIIYRTSPPSGIPY